MGIRFHKSFKVGSLLKINISKTGVSATVGKKGASVNIGSKGTYLNLSPSAVGVKGTGISYRQKLTGGYSDLFTAIGKKKAEKEAASAASTDATAAAVASVAASKKTSSKKESTVVEETTDNSEVLVYQSIEPVLTKTKFKNNLAKIEDENAKSVYQASIDGDEETIEALVEAYLNAVEIGYEINASYELDGHDLYVDLDLPEIETLSSDSKDANDIREVYADLVISLSIYLSAGFFNVSSYIDKIIMSAFTTRRNEDGDQVDDYIYSVKYTRDIFEKTDFAKVDDPYQFLTQFENRINMDVDHSLKKIKPYDAITE